MSGKGSKSGKSGSGKPPNDPSSLSVTATSMPLVSRALTKNSTIKEMKSKISVLRRRIEDGIARLKKDQRTEVDKQKYQDQMRKLIDEFKTELLALKNESHSKQVIDEMADEVNALEERLELPNRPRQDLSHAQLELQEAARPIIEEWSRAGRGVDYDSLLPAVKKQVTRLIEASKLSTILAEQLQGNPQFRCPEDAPKMKILLESIKKLFQKKIAESCINDGGEIDIDIRLADHRRYLKTLAATSVGSILKSLTGPLSIPNVLVSAVAARPAQFLRDTGSLFLAGGVLTQCLPQGTGEGVRIVSDIARAITTFMAQNPLEAFVSGHWTNAQIKKLYKMALRQMYPDLDDHTIMGIADRMDADFLARSRVGLTGEAPVDVVTLTGKLRYLIYLFKDICVGQAAFTGDMVRQGLDFPNALCRLANHAIAKLKSLSASASAQLMSRYQIIPGESLETFEDLLMNLMKMVEFENVEAVKPFLIRLLRRNNVETVWDVSVDFLRAQSDMVNPISGNTGSDSLECAASDTPQASLSPVGPFGGFGILPDAGTIPGQPDNSSEYMWGDWLAIHRFLTSPPSMGDAPEPGARCARGAQASAAAAPGGAARLHQPGAQQPLLNLARGGDDHINFSPPGSQLPASAAASAVFAAGNPPACTRGYPRTSGTPQGGRSHSRKHSVSKRTRRKGVAKKEKSKKNKRQSRRKVRRASSHKSRK
jgi:hypothetical protein